jgi:Na+-transporting NADH:ubiquinone oxidoreductase subunit C
VKGSLYTLGYALVAGTICAAVLTVVGQFTRPYREANEKAEKVRNVLGVLGVPFDKTASADDLNELAEKAVRKEERGGLTMYVYAKASEPGEVDAVAVEFSGPGLWGPVEGLLALEADRRTIRGISFYKQEETPGLGGEIGSDEFRNQFKGKSILSPGGEPGIRILRGKGTNNKANELDGLTGATMTCTKVQAMLNKVIARIVKEQTAHGQ